MVQTTTTTVVHLPTVSSSALCICDVYNVHSAVCMSYCGSSYQWWK